MNVYSSCMCVDSLPEIAERGLDIREKYISDQADEALQGAPFQPPGVLRCIVIYRPGHLHVFPFLHFDVRRA